MSGIKMVKRADGAGRNVRLTAKADPYLDHGDRFIEVVPGGRRAYLWVGTEDGPCLFTVSGEKTLRRLALAILAEVGEARQIEEGQ